MENRTHTNKKLSRPKGTVFESIPSTLRIQKRWLLWREELRDGEKTKVPKTPTGSNASVAAPQTWSDFETVKKTLSAGWATGIGFVLGGGVVGVDLDRCIDDQDNIAPWAQDIVHRLDSYTEISPSGRGLHVLVRAELPSELLDGLPKTGIKKQIESGGAIEIYWTGRYFTVTGHALVEKSVEARTKEIIALIQELNGARPQRAVETPATTAAAAGDDEIIKRIIASDQKEKFHKLFFEGDTSEYGGDDSRADLALCSILAYWTNNDIQQIDRIFRRSKLYRPKWNENRGVDTYGNLTIQKALCRDEAPTKASTEQRRDGDYGHAQILAQKLNCRLRYATHRGLWMLYDGKRWVPKTENVISKMAADILFHEYLQELAKASSKEQVRALSERLKETTFSARINGALYFLKGWPGFVTEPEEWDKNPWLLNVNNGTLDLKTGEFRPHDPEDLITLVAPVDYNPSADCPRWRAHIERFLPDPDVRRQVQRDLGKSLPGAVLEESLPIWYGTGANGKSTTSRVIMSILGGYARRAAPDLLIQTKHDRHPTEIADLVGSRVVFSVEVDEAKKLAEVLVKELTGGDRKKARFMRQDFF
ncbi:MAG TPA: phage/plasmid primase, P4 family, partial [Methanothrix sp.]